MSVIVEIRAAEGGDDAKELVHEQLSIYSYMGGRRGFHYEIIDYRPGLAIFRADGEGVEKAFANESGGHRWQRVPPNEKRGRVHTSTITVAVLPIPTEQQLRIDQKDLDIIATRGSGPGGQARNNTASCVVITHKPTGLQVRCDSERSQMQNKASALGLLRARLLDAQKSGYKANMDANRKSQVGSGQRGDKIRTIRTQDGIVTDHRLNKKIRFSDYEKGYFEDFQR